MRIRDDAAGFSLVEVVIAMVIFGFIAIALLPALIGGLRYSTEQADVASATRELNARIERARATPNCATLFTIAGPTKLREGAVVTSGGYDYVIEAGGLSCTPSALNHVKLTATTPSGTVLATVSAQIYVGS